VLEWHFGHGARRALSAGLLHIRSQTVPHPRGVPHYALRMARAVGLRRARGWRRRRHALVESAQLRLSRLAYVSRGPQPT
jgi:hypothetical protein